MSDNERKSDAASGGKRFNPLKTAWFWICNARYPSLAQSVVPAALAAFASARQPGFSCGLATAAVVGVGAAHLGANLLDDYFDYRGGDVEKRKAAVDGGVRARSLKCDYLSSGRTTLGRLFAAAVVFCAIAAVLGATIWAKRGTPILVCAGIGAFLAFFYSAPPLRLSFRALGGATVGLLFGPVAALGVSYSACGAFDLGVATISIPLGLLAANILHTHSVLDLDADRSAGKITLAVALGNRRRAVAFSALTLIASYLSIVVGVALKTIPPTSLLAFATAPLAFALWSSLRAFEKNPGQKVERREWFGPMEYWDLIVQYQMDWYMLRWYLARNLTAAFAVCLFVGYCLDRAFF